MIVLRRSVALLPPTSRRPSLVNVGASGSDSFLVHTAKLFGFGIVLPIGVGALVAGGPGMLVGIAIAASVMGNEIYDTSIRS